MKAGKTVIMYLFTLIFKNVKKTYLGKKVSPKYRKKYGKRYDEDEIESVAYAISKSHGVRIDK